MHADDEFEFTAYVTARFEQLRRTAFLLCQDWHRADDVMQTTLTSLYVNWQRARNADNTDAYVHTMMVRAFLTEQRGGWVRRVVPFGRTPEQTIDPDPSDRLSVTQALRQVPPGQRSVLVLRFYRDLTVEQTAAVLGCSPGTVKSQTSRGLAALRRALDLSQPVDSRSFDATR